MVSFVNLMLLKTQMKERHDSTSSDRTTFSGTPEYMRKEYSGTVLEQSRRKNY